eukprot:scaffold1087_cov64-Phaeocystis_antarctica.AAC.3
MWSSGRLVLNDGWMGRLSPEEVRIQLTRAVTPTHPGCNPAPPGGSPCAPRLQPHAPRLQTRAPGLQPHASKL